MVVLNIVALAFVVLHAVTWFNLAPRALVVRVQGQRLPSWMVAAGHFAAWAVVSAADRVDRPRRVVMAKRSPAEAVAWLLFSAGGMVSALVAPILLLLFGLMVPLGLAAPDHAHLASVLGHPLTRLALLVVCVLSLLHWAHRFRYALYDGLQLKR